MIIQRKVLRNVSLTAHPKGCARYVQDQIQWVEDIKQHPTTEYPMPIPSNAPKNVLVIGGSTGYGLACRIVSTFAYKAATINVSYEREPSERKTATPGYYNTMAFEQSASKLGVFAGSINADAYSDETKARTIEMIKNEMGTVDLVIYSLASPVRTDPKTGQTYHSVIKPIGESFSALSVDTSTGIVEEVTIEPATEEQISQTVSVMGGEDWKLWIEALAESGCLAPDARTIAFSYIGPELTYPVYWNGTIGMAKRDLENTAKEITQTRIPAAVSINKALATRASAVIPVVPMYISILYQVMAQAGTHEDCIMQMYRLFTTKLFSTSLQLDSEGRFRMDDWELQEDIQQEVMRRWALQQANEKLQAGDVQAFNQDYDHIQGFGYDDIDYEEDVSPLQV